jgi:hypothetical protein
MTTVLIAGSISISHLHPLFVERLSTIVDSGFSIVVGDADGADTSIQKALDELHASNVTVYCSDTEPRNNIGHWPFVAVHSPYQPGSRAFYTAKDIEMTKVADYGLMMWDTKSTGTLSNIIELLKRDRSSRVFVNKQRIFFAVSDADSLRQLLDFMSDGARAKAEEKINLSTQISAIAHKQFRLAL